MLPLLRHLRPGQRGESGRSQGKCGPPGGSRGPRQECNLRSDRRQRAGQKYVAHYRLPGQDCERESWLSGSEPSTGRISYTFSQTVNDTTLAWDPKVGAMYRHTNRNPGHYLIFIIVPRGGGSNFCNVLYDWRWVELTNDKSTAQIDLIVNPDALGRADVAMDSAASVQVVSCVPLTPEGKVPLAGDFSDQLLNLNVRVKDGKAVFAGLREGKYRFYRDKASVDAEVKRGQTTQVKFPAPKQDLARGRRRPRRREILSACLLPVVAQAPSTDGIFLWLRDDPHRPSWFGVNIAGHESPPVLVRSGSHYRVAPITCTSSNVVFCPPISPSTGEPSQTSQR